MPGDGIQLVRQKPLVDSLETILARIRSARRILLALDYEGTVAPFAPTPQSGIPPEVIELLSAISAIERVSIAIVSGGSLPDLKRRIAFPAALIANHGLEIETREFSFVHPAAEGMRREVDQACWDLRQAFESIGSVAVENQSLTASVHYRDVSDELGNWVRQTASMVLQPYRDALCCKPVLAAVQVRPRTVWNKGTALRHLLRSAGDAGTLVVCAGDDRTDSDLFRAVPFAVCLKVGDPQATHAGYDMQTPIALLKFLRHILGGMDVRDRQRPRLGPDLAGSSGSVPALPLLTKRSGA
ncbi:MAG: trehalose-phosphatase [Candidatus Solibacter sp.]